jgi:hypothetical protein
MKNTIQFQLSEETLEALRAAATREGITASILARMILHKHFSKPEADAETESKPYSYSFIPDGLVERVTAHLKKINSPQSTEGFIEEAVDNHIEIYPWFTGNICVHSEECMHRKSVEDWREDHEPKN